VKNLVGKKKAGKKPAEEANAAVAVKKAEKEAVAEGKFSPGFFSTEKKAEAKPQKAGEAGGKKARHGILGFLEKNPAVVAGVVCIVIVAVLAAVIMAPNNASVDDFWNKQSGNALLKMIVVRSDRCPACEVGSSLENLFKANGISYEINVFEESSSDGQGLIQSMGIEKLPAFIIEEKSISDSIVVKTKSGSAPLKDVLHYYVSQGDGKYEEGIFMFPEMDLEGVEEAKRAKLLLGEACGNETNFVVQYFADPYDPNTIEYSRSFENFRDLLESNKDINVSFKYNYLPTYSQFMENKYLELFGGNPEIVRENIQGAGKYLICANDAFGTKYFNRLERELYSTYCGFDFNAAEPTDINGLLACADSNHYNVFINGEELEKATRDAAIYDGIIMSECLYTVDQKIVLSQAIAQKAGIKTTPVVLVNCQYEVPLEQALTAVCTINSGLDFC